MIIHKLILQHLKAKDDPTFYTFQAEDAIGWLERSGVVLGKETRALDLGCGHGIFGAELIRRGCPTTFADEHNFLLPEIATAAFRKINVDKDDITTLGAYDLVICSNVLEHLAKPDLFLERAHKLLTPKGRLYLSWTNWLSPWGGHEFSPFHYFGPRLGIRLYDGILKRKRIHTPFQDLYPTYIGPILRRIRQSPDLVLLRAAPRYYPEFSFILHIPVLREFLTWNSALLIGRK